VRGPIEGGAAVRFALFDDSFPRSVAFGLDRARKSLRYLPKSEDALAELAAASDVLQRLTAVRDRTNTNGTPPGILGRELDRAMDEIQLALTRVHDAVADTYFGA
jgi:uncharacterized alpha-E superfamily protein